MAILIQIKKNGRIIHQCDQRCYGAKKRQCTCVCKGVLHGIPKNSAICRLRTIKSQLRNQFADQPDLKISFY